MPPRLWQRQPGETPADFTAFLAYLRLKDFVRYWTGPSVEEALEKIYGDPSPSPLDSAAAIHLTEPQIPEEKN